MAKAHWESLTLKGFGLYREGMVVEFGEGLNVLVAENEGGKSTLVAGLTAVLFGLPNTLSAGEFGKGRYRNWDAPPAFEGEVLFRAEGEQYRIRRDLETDRVSLGRWWGGNWVEEVGGEHRVQARRRNLSYEQKLEQLLGMSSGDLFLATFCLSQPLPREGELDHKVQGLLSGTSSYFQAALKALENGATDLTRHTTRLGLPGRDKNKDRRLEEVEARLAGLQRHWEESRSALDSLAMLQEEMEKGRIEREALLVQAEAQEGLLQAWAEWRRLAERYRAALTIQLDLGKAVRGARQAEEKLERDRDALAREYPELAGVAAGAGAALEQLVAQEERAGRRTAELADLEDKIRGMRQQQEELQKQQLREFQEETTEEGRRSAGKRQLPEGLKASLAGEIAVLTAGSPQLREACGHYSSRRAALEREVLEKEKALREAGERAEAYRKAEESFREQFRDLEGLPGGATEAVLQKLTLLQRRREVESRRAAPQLVSLMLLLLFFGGILLSMLAAPLALFSLLALALWYKARLPARREGKRLELQMQALNSSLGPLATVGEAELGSAGERLRSRRAALENLERQRQTLAGSGELNALAIAAGEAQVALDSFLEDLGIKVKKALTIQRSREDLAARLTGEEERRERLAGEMRGWLAELEGKRADLAALLAAAGGDASAALRRHREYRQGQVELESLSASLEGILRGQGAASLDELERKLLDAQNQATQALDSWQRLIDSRPGLPGREQAEQAVEVEAAYHSQVEDLSRTKRQLKELEERLHGLRMRQAQLLGQDALNLAGAEEQITGLEEERERLQLEAEALALAYTELSAAVEQFTSSHRQRLEEAASAYFARFTGVPGRGVLLDQSFHIQARQPDGRAVPPAQLSQGAQDQLYISLRLAIADLLAGGCALPLLCDDPFVNCDSARLELIRQSLTALAAERQVILLTHRSDLAGWGTGVSRRFL